MNKIAIFYHIYQYGDWENVVKEQFGKLKSTGLIDAASYIYFGVSGDELLPLEKDDYDNITTIQRYYGDDKKKGEAPTIYALYEFCKNKQEDWNVLFIHTKGVTWSKNEKIKLYVSSLEELDIIWSDIKNPKHKLLKIDYYSNVKKWRNYLEFFLIEKWKTCVNKLDVPSLLTEYGTYQTFDTVGTEWTPYFLVNELGTKEALEKIHDLVHYSGNMWWASSRYIKTLNWDFVNDISYFFGDNIEGTRFLSEAWIGLNKPVFYNFYNTNRDLYINAIEEYEYRNKFMVNNKNTATNGRICMISMFKNEAAGIGRMLESVAPYIDFWVLQDNGSTDGSPQIVEDWARKYNIPGFMYKCEEGWIGYGWNRDHVLQKALQANHNCNWIMKMDCDEALEVDDGFNWNELNDHSTHAYSVHAKAPGCQYFRTWMWRSDLPWRFNHDPAHETIYLENRTKENDDKENYSYKNLGLQFKMLCGGNATGESHQNPAKYALDALKLEEKLIRENTLLENMYHFFYIGKSYEDSMPNKLPLGEVHNAEMARRAIFYFTEWLEVKYPGFKETKITSQNFIDEMAYYACNAIGLAYRNLGEHYKAIEWWKITEQFAPQRNDHLVNLATTYWELTDYKKMLQITSRLVQPDRKNPFPDKGSFAICPINYYDTGTYVQFLHEQATEMQKYLPLGSIFSLNKNSRKKLFVVDNFYEDPHAVRELALQQEFNNDLRFYKGKRTERVFHTPQIKQRFEEIMGVKIKEFPGQGTMNGVFQYCTPEDLLVHHHDSQTWAAMIFLTPDAPFETGTSFYRHKQTGITLAEQENSQRYSMHGFYDRTKFELIDQVGNVFNRLVIFDARCLHSATQYFGTKKEDARLFQIFFFD